MARPGTTAFSDRGATFDQILVEGRLGGVASLRTYISSRRMQLLRKLSTLPAGSEGHRRYEAAHQAFVEVEALLPKILNGNSAGKAGIGAAYLKGRQK